MPFPQLYLELSAVFGNILAFDIEFILPFTRECSFPQRENLYYYSLIIYTLSPLVVLAVGLGALWSAGGPLREVEEELKNSSVKDKAKIRTKLEERRKEEEEAYH